MKTQPNNTPPKPDPGEFSQPTIRSGNLPETPQDYIKPPAVKPPKEDSKK
jgi:hypothetical protein